MDKRSFRNKNIDLHLFKYGDAELIFRNVADIVRKTGDDQYEIVKENVTVIGIVE